MLYQIVKVPPRICGDDRSVDLIMNHTDPVYQSNLDWQKIQSGFACALHMHQPTIPVDGELINHLQYMFANPHQGDNHNAETFAWCYARMGEFIPKLVQEGKNPRIMLDYSGNLLWGLQQMGRDDILNHLKKITCNPLYYPHVEWLGTMWSHAVVPSTPIPDIFLQIRAWQYQFAAIFGEAALNRVRGFSPPEMHLPNHPDTLYEYIKSLKQCGYRWLLVQEDSIERLDGKSLEYSDKFIPNLLQSYNSQGEVISIPILIKTQGSDTKLVAQNQPYHQAKGISRQKLGNFDLPSLVSQIADGENGGVMMNEYPRDFLPLWEQILGNGIDRTGVVGINGTEYLELLESQGISSKDFPLVQAVNQHKIWQKISPEKATTQEVEAIIQELKNNDHTFALDGASWTNNLSWVKGYENVLEPMQRLSALFHQKYDGKTFDQLAVEPHYQDALLYNLLLQTSCFRYWGQGTWTDYANELYHRGKSKILDS